MKIEKLKGCPFCGKQPEGSPEFPEVEGDSWFEIACVNPKCHSEVVVNGNSDLEDHNKIKRSAITRWNRRF